MSVPRQNIQELFQKLVSNECTEQETELFFQLVKDLPEDDVLIAQLDAWWDSIEPGEVKDLVRERRIWQQVQENNHPELYVQAPVHLLYRKRTWNIAAAVALLIMAGVFLWTQRRPQPDYTASLAQILDSTIRPGTDGAVLTLADGRQILLDSLKDGVIASQTGAEIMLQDGRLAYNAAGEKGNEPAWNTITTPRGRQFKIILPDGTQVWLNAASSITYPTFFAGAERRVEVTGEVYMDVARDSRKKFKVKVNNQAVVEVTGTEFNVKAYTDEASLATTLLEGSVKLYKATDTSCWHCGGVQTQELSPATAVSLSPGQQGLIESNNKQQPKNRSNSGILILNDIDTDKILAWKNGYFNFTGMSSREAMNQLVRWYNIEVVYENDVPDIEFFGDLRRDMNLADVLTALEAAGVQFKVIAGRKLVVLPN
jgi:transmembrane sensor